MEATFHVVIKLVSEPEDSRSSQDSTVEVFNDFVLSEGKEFIIINLSYS